MDYSLKDAPLYPSSLSDKFGNLDMSKFPLPAGLGKDMLIGIFVIFLIFYCIVSAVLFYHWYAYGMKNKMIVSAEVLFTAVSLTLFSGAFLMLVNM